MTDTWTWDALKSRKTTPREVVPIVIDLEWGERLGQAQVRHAVLMKQANARPSDTTLLAELEDLAAEIEALQREKPDKVCEFVFKSIPPDRYEKLVNAHPPTRDQRTKAAQRGETVSFNADTFPQALVRACLVSPKLTPAQIDEIWTPGEEGHDDETDAPAGVRWSSGELAALFQGAQIANLGRQRVE